MKQLTDLAPPKLPRGKESKHDSARSGAARLADALPIAIVARDDRGRVAFVNAAARRDLALGDLDSTSMTLTVIRRGEDSSSDDVVYLLSAENEALARIVAKPIKLPLDGQGDLEILTFASKDADTPQPLGTAPEARTDAAANPRRRKVFAPAPGTIFHPRELLACAVRRIRRHFRGDLELLVAAAPTKRCDRRARLDEIAFAEVLLSSATWLAARSSAKAIELSATVAGHRLKVALEGQPSFVGSRNDYERDWLRTARPFIESHRATIELHDDEERCGIVVALPLLR